MFETEELPQRDEGNGLEVACYIVMALLAGLAAIGIAGL